FLLSIFPMKRNVTEFSSENFYQFLYQKTRLLCSHLPCKMSISQYAPFLAHTETGQKVCLLLVILRYLSFVINYYNYPFFRTLTGRQDLLHNIYQELKNDQPAWTCII